MEKNFVGHPVYKMCFLQNIAKLKLYQNSESQSSLDYVVVVVCYIESHLTGPFLTLPFLDDDLVAAGDVEEGAREVELDLKLLILMTML